MILMKFSVVCLNYILNDALTVYCFFSIKVFPARVRLKDESFGFQ